MACGPGPGLAALNGQIDAAKDAVNGIVADAEAGIAGAIDSLDTALDSAVGNVVGAVKGLMPSIELPELDIPDLDSLLPELPELPEPPQKLQDALGKLTAFANDPLAAIGIGDPSKGLQAQLDSIGAKFGVDVNAFKDALLGGELNLDNLCKLVPNVELGPDGIAITKGTPATAPEKDAENPPEPPAFPELKTFSSESLTKLNDSISAKLKESENAVKEQVDGLKNNLALPNINLV